MMLTDSNTLRTDTVHSRLFSMRTDRTTACCSTSWNKTLLFTCQPLYNSDNSWMDVSAKN